MLGLLGIHDIKLVRLTTMTTEEIKIFGNET